jgi:hypothetical protein
MAFEPPVNFSSGLVKKRRQIQIIRGCGIDFGAFLLSFSVSQKHLAFFHSHFS